VTAFAPKYCPFESHHCVAERQPVSRGQGAVCRRKTSTPTHDIRVFDLHLTPSIECQGVNALMAAAKKTSPTLPFEARDKARATSSFNFKLSFVVRRSLIECRTCYCSTIRFVFVSGVCFF
jgi:hypothetical protein